MGRDAQVSWRRRAPNIKVHRRCWSATVDAIGLAQTGKDDEFIPFNDETGLAWMDK
jgi:hypothetical protein